MSEIFQKLYDEFIESCGEDEPNYDKSYSAGYRNAKKAALDILDKYHNTYSYRYIREEIEKI